MAQVTASFGRSPACSACAACAAKLPESCAGHCSYAAGSPRCSPRDRLCAVCARCVCLRSISRQGTATPWLAAAQVTVCASGNGPVPTCPMQCSCIIAHNACLARAAPCPPRRTPSSRTAWSTCPRGARGVRRRGSSRQTQWGGRGCSCRASRACPELRPLHLRLQWPVLYPSSYAVPSRRGHLLLGLPLPAAPAAAGRRAPTWRGWRHPGHATGRQQQQVRCR